MCFSEREWSSLLAQTGFGLKPLLFRDNEDSAANEKTLFVSTAVDATQENGPERIDKCYIISSTNDSASLDLSASLEVILKQIAGLEVICLDSRHIRIHGLQGSLCFVLLGLNTFECFTLSSDDYHDLKHLLLNCTNMIWMMADTLCSPLGSTATGLIRNVRWERCMENVNFVTLEFSEPRPSPNTMAEKIVDLYHNTLQAPSCIERNGEFTFRAGLFWTKRLKENDSINEFLRRKYAPKPQPKPLEMNVDRPLKLECTGTGSHRSIYFTHDPAQEVPLLGQEVKIRVLATGLSLPKTVTTSGDIFADSLGYEVVGQVVAVGNDVKTLQIQDWVMALVCGASSGTLRTFVRCPPDLAHCIPKNSDIADAAGVPLAFSTALYGLYGIGRLAPGETVLIYSPAGCIGQAAVQLAQATGARVLAVCSTAEKETLIKHCGLKKEEIVDDGDDSVRAGIARSCNNMVWMSSSAPVRKPARIRPGGVLRRLAGSSTWRRMIPYFGHHWTCCPSPGGPRTPVSTSPSWPIAARRRCPRSSPT
jgi:hypothetical protein